MGIEHRVRAIRAALQYAGEGQLSFDTVDVRLEDGKQVLELTGTHLDGTPFHITSKPFTGEPGEIARRIAGQLVVERRQIAPTPNWEQDIMTDTPISGLFASLRAELDKATARASHVAGKAKGSVANLHAVLDAAEGTVAQLDASAADIQAALGLSTNGGPPLDPK